MGASFETVPAANSADRIFEAFFQNSSTGPRQSIPARDTADPIMTAWRIPEAPSDFVPADQALRLIQDRADMGSLHKSDIIVRFARTNEELMRHCEDHFSEVA